MIRNLLLQQSSHMQVKQQKLIEIHQIFSEYLVVRSGAQKNISFIEMIGLLSFYIMLFNAYVSTLLQFAD